MNEQDFKIKILKRNLSEQDLSGKKNEVKKFKSDDDDSFYSLHHLGDTSETELRDKKNETKKLKSYDTRLLTPLTEERNFFTFINAGIKHISTVSNLKFVFSNFRFNIKNLLLVGELHNFKNTKLVEGLKLDNNALKKRDEFYFSQFEKFALENKLETMLLFEGPYEIGPINFSKIESVDTKSSITEISARYCLSNKNVNDLFFCKYSDYRQRYTTSLINICFKAKIAKYAIEDMQTIKTKCNRYNVEKLITKYCAYGGLNLLNDIKPFLDDSGVVDEKMKISIYERINNLFILNLLNVLMKYDIDILILNLIETDFLTDFTLYVIIERWINNFCLFVMGIRESGLNEILFKFLLEKLNKHIISDEVFKNTKEDLLELCIKTCQKINPSNYFTTIYYTKYYTRYKVFEDLFKFLRHTYTKYNPLTSIRNISLMIIENKNSLDTYSNSLSQIKDWVINIGIKNTVFNTADKTFLKHLFTRLDKYFTTDSFQEIVHSNGCLNEILYSLKFCIYTLNLIEINDPLRIYFKFTNFDSCNFLKKFTRMVGFEMPIFELFIILCLYCRGREKNIIVQAGAAHTRKIVDFLNTDMGKFDDTNDKFVDENKIKECVNYFFKKSN